MNSIDFAEKGLEEYEGFATNYINKDISNENLKLNRKSLEKI